MSSPSFEAEIERNRTAEQAPTASIEIAGDQSDLNVRLRGCFITGSELTSPSTGKRLEVLHSDEDESTPKLTASHIMAPVGPSDGIGGQHGFPRWADFKQFPLDDAGNIKRISFQAMRSDNGLALSKLFELGGNEITMTTSLSNPGMAPVGTSLGEHLYFTLADERFDGLRIGNGTIDERFGAGAQEKIMNGEPLFWSNFDAHASSGILIEFPAGHSIRLSAEADIPTSDTYSPQLGMLIWHRKGSNSICFEPTLGFNDGKGDQLLLPPYEEAKLRTSIALL